VKRNFKIRGSWVKGRANILLTAALMAAACYGLVIAVNGCAPTYSKEKFKESIAKVCKDEYKLDVKVETLGKTVAVYLPLENLIDFTFSITKSAGEKINNVILTVSRVALSTDAKYDFYVVIAHDIRIPEIQIVIIKTVEDVKRFLLNDISRNDYAKRMIIDIRFSPQAQKERAIQEVFEKAAIDKRAQEDVMQEFFRSEPTGLGDIGYWNGKFYIKDITMQEFLAEQLASRIKMAFHEDKGLTEAFMLKGSKCAYSYKDGRRVFKLDITTERKFTAKPEIAADNALLLKMALNEAAQTVHSYDFRDFNDIEISYDKDKEALKVSREELEDYRKKKIKIDYFVNKKQE
jgi:hypothetical protein